jgi:hypothetical protein
MREPRATEVIGSMAGEEVYEKQEEDSLDRSIASEKHR